ncbi:MAG TPA: transposase [Humisphaera sp.]
MAGIERELAALPPGTQDAERRRRLEAWLDAGYGSCILREPAAAECVIGAWRHFAGERYDLIAWVVMPNHVHVLVRVYDGQPLGRIVQSWKSYTGRRIAQMGRSGDAGLQPGSSADVGRAGLKPGVPGGGVWMRDYWDRYIRDERHFAAVVRYIHENPVKAGLAANAAAWPWSSAAETA